MSSMGARAGTLAVNVAAPATNQSVSLSGTGTAINLSTAALAFGSQLLGTTSASSRVTLTNDGATALSITGITLGGTNPSDFTMSSSCGVTLSAKTSCTINVRFRPTTSGARAAAITVATSDPAGPQTVSLSGTGIAPVAVVSPGTLTFSSTQNVTSTAQVETLSNTGTAPLTIVGGITIGGTNASQFAQTNNCGASVAVGSSWTINVTFPPTSVGTGTKSASLNVNVAAPATSPSVSLTGSVISPVLTLSPATLAFGTLSRGLTSAPRTVTVSNTGNAPLTINGISIGGFSASQFAQTNICGTLPVTLVPGASCAVSVTFRPTTVGTMNASMNVAVAAPTTSKSVSLSGTGR